METKMSVMDGFLVTSHRAIRSPTVAVSLLGRRFAARMMGIIAHRLRLANVDTSGRSGTANVICDTLDLSIAEVRRPTRIVIQAERIVVSRRMAASSTLRGERHCLFVILKLGWQSVR
jgi:hypothetical protein